MNLKRFGFSLGAIILTLWTTHFLVRMWIEYGNEFSRVRGLFTFEENVGVDKLQVPILREGSFPRIAVQQRSMSAAIDEAVSKLRIRDVKFGGKVVDISFAGTFLPNNRDFTNYLLLTIKEELVRGGARDVNFVYSNTHYSLGRSTVPEGVATEIDTAFMVAKQSQLSGKSTQKDATRKVKDRVEMILRVKEAGVDTTDLSIYNWLYYVWVATVIAIVTFAIGLAGFLLARTLWADRERVGGVIGTIFGFLLSLNIASWLFFIFPPNQPVYKIETVVALSYFAKLEDRIFAEDSRASVVVILDPTNMAGPTIYGIPRVVRPADGGLEPLP